MELVVQNPSSREITDEWINETVEDLVALEQQAQKRSRLSLENKVEEMGRRFEQGCKVYALFQAKNFDTYGDGLMKSIAQEAERKHGARLSTRQLYEWRRVARLWTEHRDPTDFLAWVWEVVDSRGTITHKYVKEHVREEEERRERLLQGTNGHAEEGQRQLTSGEDEPLSNGQASEQEQASPQGDGAQRPQPAPPTTDADYEVIEDEDVEVVEPEGWYDDAGYIGYVERQPCCACGEGPTLAHHYVEREAEGRSHDTFVVPLCQEHDLEWEDVGGRAFCETHQLNLWKVVAYLLAEYQAGRKL